MISYLTSTNIYMRVQRMIIYFLILALLLIIIKEVTLNKFDCLHYYFKTEFTDQVFVLMVLIVIQDSVIIILNKWVFFYSVPQ